MNSLLQHLLVLRGKIVRSKAVEVFSFIALIKILVTKVFITNHVSNCVIKNYQCITFFTWAVLFNIF